MSARPSTASVAYQGRNRDLPARVLPAHHSTPAQRGGIVTDPTPSPGPARGGRARHGRSRHRLQLTARGRAAADWAGHRQLPDHPRRRPRRVRRITRPARTWTPSGRRSAWPGSRSRPASPAPQSSPHGPATPSPVGRYRYRPAVDARPGHHPPVARPAGRGRRRARTHPCPLLPPPGRLRPRCAPHPGRAARHAARHPWPAGRPALDADGAGLPRRPLARQPTSCGPATPYRPCSTSGRRTRSCRRLLGSVGLLAILQAVDADHSLIAWWPD
ncbi:hypothetical protein SAMN05660976_00690 [Nonomuraea pusilla]|uniref:Uncharacterized protein n=1 Tax=Nonomuraea pusilla TaxID=46177 RepID=A0A1H7I4N9_9ACTN|nr:hypothetical protein SAMN05660976_00690 [Nonomuraea pusilla]